ncbi:hypothetical protein FB45DRAFT_357645 [Roridomyces roridus]|uniref:Secreted protein n=1 Tax=Roridomyces roridus TaxID=1738132 RepID=A0AAD7C7R1_9AGAR|nr:hypothetical protein FB45DRAFT_357645 [Roridomyces roridus]
MDGNHRQALVWRQHSRMLLLFGIALTRATPTSGPHIHSLQETRFTVSCAAPPSFVLAKSLVLSAAAGPHSIDLLSNLHLLQTAVLPLRSYEGQIYCSDRTAPSSEKPVRESVRTFALAECRGLIASHLFHLVGTAFLNHIGGARPLPANAWLEQTHAPTRVG